MNENYEQDMYALKLHEGIKFDSGVEILRVPGGWIYAMYPGGKITFVPFNDEFKP